MLVSSAVSVATATPSPATATLLSLCSRVGPVTLLPTPSGPLPLPAPWTHLLSGCPVSVSLRHFGPLADAEETVLRLLDQGTCCVVVTTAHIQWDVDFPADWRTRVFWAVAADVEEAVQAVQKGCSVEVEVLKDEEVAVAVQIVELAVQMGVKVRVLEARAQVGELKRSWGEILSKFEGDQVELVISSAIQNGSFRPSRIITDRMVSDRQDGLVPTIVVDECGIALGMVYSNKESVENAVEFGKGIYHSRKRGLWEKGATSGATQELISIRLDCDCDNLRFTVYQNGKGFCHLDRRTCWDEDSGLGHLFRTLRSRRDFPVSKSYTNRLLNDAGLLKAKIREEAEELIEAGDVKDPEQVAAEAADLLYFTSVLCVREGVSLNDIEKWLNARSLRVRRRPGNAKPKFLEQSN